MVKDKWGFIDEQGKAVINANYENVGFFVENIAAVSTDTEKFYINKKEIRNWFLMKIMTTLGFLEH